MLELVLLPFLLGGVMSTLRLENECNQIFIRLVFEWPIEKRYTHKDRHMFKTDGKYER